MAWRFEPGEGVRSAFRRVSAEEIAKVRAGLSGPEDHRDKAIHEARQAFKRLRALVRLAKPPLGSDFAAENKRWRDAGRLLAGSRDTTVTLQCFNRLVERIECPARIANRLRTRIAGKDGNGASEDTEINLRKVLALLDEAEVSVAELDWPNSKGALLHGFHRGQKRLRRDWKAACNGAEPDQLHSWRKRVKDQAAQLRLFRRVVPPAFRKRIADEKETAELLGNEHDLWLLAERLRSGSFPRDLAELREKLLARIEAEREGLRKEAFKTGEDFSSQKAGVFADAIGAAWEKAAKRKAKKSSGKRRRASGADAEAISPQR